MENVLSKIPKFVINLDRRTDRLEAVDKEFESMGWEYERVSGIDTGCHRGCTLSHVEVARIAKERGLHQYMVFEDDVKFMPYMKWWIRKMRMRFEWDLLNFGPSIHTPVKKDRVQHPFIHLDRDITKRNVDGLPQDCEVLCAHALIIKHTIYDDILQCDGEEVIDRFLGRVVYKKYNCYSTEWPLATQHPGISDIGGGDNNHYMITYNWSQHVDESFPEKYWYHELCI